MALVRIDEKTLVQKVKTVIIGKEKPNWATRISVLLGFGFWFFYMAYLCVILFSILFIDSLEDPDLIRNSFAKIGGSYNFNIKYADFGWTAIDVIYYHALFTIGLLMLSLLGMIFIYRRKQLGYLLYLTGNIGSIIFTLYFLGISYVNDQISVIDKYLFLGITVYFFIAMFLLKRNKALRQEP
ncbi:MAG: hypothetical protein AB8B72_04355 [Crocinitomicaceae bacterium]